MPRSALFAGTAFFVAFAASTVLAAEQFHADLSGAKEVPPVETPASGEATVTLDDSTLRWTITYEDLKADAVAAHFHGPAGPDANAGPQVDIGPHGLDSPMKGSAQLTDEQIAQLKAGQWYINVHTPEHGAGEIRGQVTPGEG